MRNAALAFAVSLAASPALAEAPPQFKGRDIIAFVPHKVGLAYGRDFFEKYPSTRCQTKPSGGAGRFRYTCRATKAEAGIEATLEIEQPNGNLILHELRISGNPLDLQKAFGKLPSLDDSGASPGPPTPVWVDMDVAQEDHIRVGKWEAFIGYYGPGTNFDCSYKAQDNGNIEITCRNSDTRVEHRYLGKRTQQNAILLQAAIIDANFMVGKALHEFLDMILNHPEIGPNGDSG